MPVTIASSAPMWGKQCSFGLQPQDAAASDERSDRSVVRLDNASEASAHDFAGMGHAAKLNRSGERLLVVRSLRGGETYDRA